MCIHLRRARIRRVANNHLGGARLGWVVRDGQPAAVPHRRGPARRRRLRRLRRRETPLAQRLQRAARQPPRRAGVLHQLAHGARHVAQQPVRHLRRGRAAAVADERAQLICARRGHRCIHIHHLTQLVLAPRRQAAKHPRPLARRHHARQPPDERVRRSRLVQRARPHRKLGHQHVDARRDALGERVPLPRHSHCCGAHVRGRASKRQVWRQPVVACQHPKVAQVALDARGGAQDWNIKDQCARAAGGGARVVIRHLSPEGEELASPKKSS